MPMKLYEAPSDVRIRVISDDFKDDSGNYMEVNFHHIDGAYSFCKDDEGNTIHLAAWTQVELVK